MALEYYNKHCEEKKFLDELLKYKYSINTISDEIEKMIEIDIDN